VCAACLAPPEPLRAEFFCRLCQTPFQNAFALNADQVCTLCRSGLRGFDAAYCLGAYEGGFRKLIHLFKYNRMQSLRRPLSEMLATALPRDAHFDAVTCVPLHWSRRYQRGFNQSELLAVDIARRWGVPYVRTLRRHRSTANQTALTHAQRRVNVAGAFRMRRAIIGSNIVGSSTPLNKVSGQHMLLVDDVMTTGATAQACAAALRRAGARSVTLLTLARVDRRLA
jgi:ComF family protein